MLMKADILLLDEVRRLLMMGLEFTTNGQTLLGEKATLGEKIG